MPALRPNQLVLLGLLAEGPAHPYALHRALVDRRLDRWAPMGFSSVYQVAGTLGAAGWTVAVDEPEPTDARGARARRPLRLTPAGWEALREGVAAALAGPPEDGVGLELALMFRGVLPPARVRAAFEARLATVEAALGELGPAHGAVPGAWQGYAAPIFAHRRAVLEAERAFAQHALASFAG